MNCAPLRNWEMMVIFKASHELLFLRYLANNWPLGKIKLVLNLNYPKVKHFLCYKSGKVVYKNGSENIVYTDNFYGNFSVTVKVYIINYLCAFVNHGSNCVIKTLRHRMSRIYT